MYYSRKKKIKAKNAAADPKSAAVDKKVSNPPPNPLLVNLFEVFVSRQPPSTPPILQPPPPLPRLLWP